MAARHDDLIRLNRAFLLAVAGDKAGFGQNPLLVPRKPRFLHGLSGVDEAREVFGDGIDALDDLILNAAFVGNADFGVRMGIASSVSGIEPSWMGIASRIS